jgi:hypothetical protein
VQLEAGFRQTQLTIRPERYLRGVFWTEGNDPMTVMSCSEEVHAYNRLHILIFSNTFVPI